MRPERRRKRLLRAFARRGQAGAVAIVLVMGLLLLALLGVAYGARTVLAEQKASAAQYHGTRAAQAADGGLEWALAMVNGGSLDDRCQPSASPAPGFIARSLLPSVPEGAFALSSDAGRVAQPACAMGESGPWSCQCAASSSAALQSPRPGPSFVLRLTGVSEPSGTPAPGLMEIVAEGCSETAAGPVPCSSSSPAAGHAFARWQAALLPALFQVPPGALNASGSVSCGSQPVEFVNADPSTGWAVIAGHDWKCDEATLAGPAGPSSARPVRANDPAWSARGLDAAMKAFLGFDASTWPGLPAVHPIEGGSDDSAAISQAVSQGFRLLWSPGGLRLSDVELGTEKAPVLIATDGPIELRGDVRITGLLLGRSLAWQGGSVGLSWLHGAAIVAGDVDLQGAASLAYSVAALRNLRWHAGSWVRIPGSWRDGP